MIATGKKIEGRKREWISRLTGIPDSTVKNILAELNKQQETERPLLSDNTNDKKDNGETSIKKFKSFLKVINKVDLSEYSNDNINLLRDLSIEITEALDDM